jgi:hypothetical protein
VTQLPMVGCLVIVWVLVTRLTGNVPERSGSILVGLYRQCWVISLWLVQM